MNLLEVNKDVNKYQYETELKEDWTRISATGKGDCDSYAMEKYFRCRKFINPECLCIATCKTETGEHHAVLLVRVNKDLFVLDNRTDLIGAYQDSKYTFDYVPDYIKE